jgi:hypothetical protein
MFECFVILNYLERKYMKQLKFDRNSSSTFFFKIAQLFMTIR